MAQVSGETRVSPLEHEVGTTVVAFDACAEAMGAKDPWHDALVENHLDEDGEWWYEVKFKAGERCSILRPAGVRSRA